MKLKKSLKLKEKLKESQVLEDKTNSKKSKLKIPLIAQKTKVKV